MRGVEEKRSWIVCHERKSTGVAVLAFDGRKRRNISSQKEGE
jgi:hypothetical protein